MSDRSRRDTSLSAYEQYTREMKDYPPLTPAQEEALVERARQGDREALASLVEGCLHYVMAMSVQYVTRCEHTDYLDLVQVGNLAMLEVAERSLSLPKPGDFLRKTARMRILEYHVKSDPLIHTPGYEPRHELSSLDEPLTEGTETLLEEVLAEPEPVPAPVERDYTALYDAVAALPELRRRIIEERFGLEGHAPHSTAALARELFPQLAPDQRTHLIQNQEALALRELQHRLTAVYLPETCQTPREYYTLREVMALFGADRDTVYRWVYTGKLTSYPAPSSLKRVGGTGSVPRWVYAKAEVDALLKRQQAQAAKRTARETPAEYYTLQEIMQRFRVSRSKVYRLAKLGKLIRYPAPSLREGVRLAGVIPASVYAKHEVEDLFGRADVDAVSEVA